MALTEPLTRTAHPSRDRAEAPVLELQGLRKSFVASGPPAVSDFDLQVPRGAVAALLGPSGCGKTTLLRLIAGFEEPDGGRVVVAGSEVSGAGRWLPPERRNIGFVFQSYALFPHLDVLGNVAFGLRGLSAERRRARAREVLDLVGLTIFSRRYPRELSGGQQQRVALARALAPQPEVILLDEPFSNLDAALRGSTREEVRRILKESGTTAVLVTHDQEEAMTFADALAVMRAGRLEQQGPPEEVYLKPRTAFVASFVGHSNLIRGHAQGASAETELGRLRLERPAQGPVLLALRPESLAFDSVGAEVRILQRAFKGHDLTFTCELLGGERGRLMVHTTPSCTLRAGDVARIRPVAAAVPLAAS